MSQPGAFNFKNTNQINTSSFSNKAEKKFNLVLSLILKHESPAFKKTCSSYFCVDPNKSSVNACHIQIIKKYYLKNKCFFNLGIEKF